MRLVGSILLALPVLLVTTQSGAIVAKPEPRHCAAWSNADAVLIGRVGARRLSADGDVISWPVTVHQTLKGNVPATIVVTSENASSRATPNELQRNMLFLHKIGRRFEIRGSDPNGGGPRLAAMEAEARKLARPGKRATGSVSILVADEVGAPRQGYAVRLSQRQGKLVRTVRTGSKGEVRLDLPPGAWSADVVEPGWYSRTSLYSYNSDRFMLRAGGCADLRLEPIKNKGT